MNKKQTILNISLSGIFLALGIVLPFLTGQIPEIGSMLCPMHIPVLICGFICGYKYGLIVGFITPLLRSFIFSMPPLYPAAIVMAFELAGYGLVTGILHHFFIKINKNNIATKYTTLISAMIAGRLIWGIVRFIIACIDETIPLTLNIFISASFITAWPGIIIQLILIPAIITALEKSGVITYQVNQK